jgi:hypothetical protein
MLEYKYWMAYIEERQASVCDPTMKKINAKQQMKINIEDILQGQIHCLH